MSRKFIYYLEGLSRSIVITDQNKDMSLEEISIRASESMTGDKLSKFETKTDVLLVRPNEIKAIHIVDDYKDDVDNTIDDKNLQAFIPDINLDDIEDKEGPIEVDPTLDTENKNNEEIDDTEGEITIPEEIIKDVDGINNSD